MNLDRIIAVRTDKTVYRDGDRCMKVFVGNQRPSEILKEAYLQTAFAEAGLPVPQIFEVTKVNEKWTVVSEYIKGRTLDRLISENPEKRYEYTEILVSLQKRIHAVRSLSVRSQNAMIEGVLKSEIFDEKQKKIILKSSKSLSFDNSLCHGNLIFENIVIKPDGAAVILDCRHAFSGNADFDAALTYSGLYMQSIDAANDYLAAYCTGAEEKFSAVKGLVPSAAAVRMKHTVIGNRNILCSLIK